MVTAHGLVVAQAVGFFVREEGAEVLDDALARSDVPRGKDAFALNARAMDGDGRRLGARGTIVSLASKQTPSHWTSPTGCRPRLFGVSDEPVAKPLGCLAQARQERGIGQRAVEHRGGGDGGERSFVGRNARPVGVHRRRKVEAQHARISCPCGERARVGADVRPDLVDVANELPAPGTEILGCAIRAPQPASSRMTTMGRPA